MLEFDNVHLNNVIIHKTGNKAREEELILSDTELTVDNTIQELLMDFFLGHFTEEAFYNFCSEDGLENNEVYASAKNIFQDHDSFIEESKKIATKLFDAGSHPKIKEGDLYIASFSDLVVDGELVDAIGIFKSETKQDFLQIRTGSNGFDIKIEEGINLNKIDKAALIYNTEEEFGYKINIIDTVNKQEAQYWRNDFLGIEQRKDDFYQTQKYMELCKDFVKEVYNEEHEVEKPQQIAMLNKSANYFKENETFSQQDFEENVLSQPDVIEAFNEYKQQYAEEKKVEFKEDFGVSDQAAKKQQSKMKAVLKLDKNFHIYIHGDEGRIVKGVDPDTGMKFYQIFYENEE
ncbi:MAG: nucleoid-associated protein [Bacteroidales bacterium]|nr:nucleoid-associated protein [Bacteroidales bacterium]